jgi:hypothetical protein
MHVSAKAVYGFNPAELLHHQQFVSVAKSVIARE